jgi:hypothetical protein
VRKRAVVLSAVLVVAGFACAELFDEPSQCKTDRDCERFGDAVCNTAQAVCVSRAQAQAEAGFDAPTADVVDDTVLPPIDCAMVARPKPVATVPYDTTDGGAGDITVSKTLDCTKDWTLDRRIYIRPGAVLTIQENTTIRGNAGARVVVTPGGRLAAAGRRDQPIVFTSAQATPAAGNWDGVYVLGSAPPNNNGPYGGDTTLAAGGNNPDDNSGTLEFVRIEYAGEGLVFGGAGRGTKVDHVQVLRSGDNCFTLYGGTVNAKHLVCQFPTDEQFEIDARYTGKLQFIFGQKTPTGATQVGRNGILTSVAGTAPVIYNATILGENLAAAAQGYGLVFRTNTAMDVNNAIISGWFTGIDAQGALGTPIELRGSIVFGNATNPAYAEVDAGEPDAGDPLSDEDNGFDEIAFFGVGGRGNSTTNPGLMAPFNAAAPQPWPAAAITAGARTPPATTENFFDTTAIYIGAFRDANDAWMSQWTRFGN